MNINIRSLVFAIFMAGVFSILAVTAYSGISGQAKKALGSI